MCLSAFSLLSSTKNVSSSLSCILFSFLFPLLLLPPEYKKSEYIFMCTNTSDNVKAMCVLVCDIQQRFCGIKQQQRCCKNNSMEILFVFVSLSPPLPRPLQIIFSLSLAAARFTFACQLRIVLSLACVWYSILSCGLDIIFHPHFGIFSLSSLYIQLLWLLPCSGWCDIIFSLFSFFLLFRRKKNVREQHNNKTT